MKYFKREFGVHILEAAKVKYKHKYILSDNETKRQAL